jgi:hypothetical protein
MGQCVKLAPKSNKEAHKMEGTNHLSKLKEFFGVDMGTFASFWKSLTNDDKEQFKASIEKWDGKSEFVPA